MTNPVYEKLKQPKYAIFFVLRIICSLFCGLVAIQAFSASGIINTFFWIVLGVQFIFDAEMFKDAFKIDRFFAIPVIVVLILITTNA